MTYVFISYSSVDREFAQSLFHSLEFYGVPLFLDQRNIKVGDSIPGRIYEALDRATHLVHVLSQSSVRSTWVQEELSVAKTKQLANRGCRVLPVLLEDVELPVSLSHIKYCDFRRWKMRDQYSESLQQLLLSLDIRADWPAETANLHGYATAVAGLSKLAAAAAYLTGLYFQLERAGFEKGKWQESATRHGLNETLRKEPDLDWFSRESHAWLEDLRAKYGVSLLRQEALRSAYEVVTEDFGFCQEHRVPYERIRRAEQNARELEAIVHSLLLEVERAFAGFRPAPDT